ncbi:MAG TPA: hypothetical protein VGK48_07750 [Terriglobia bacterium]|jgi:hypothetical protein
MPRFNAGDRVQLVGDIARFYKCAVGLIVDNGGTGVSVLNQYKARLADGTTAVFFDFQLQTPPAIHARTVFDSAVSKKEAGTRGALSGRHVQLVSRDVEIHLKVSGSLQKSIIGQVATGTALVGCTLVTLTQNGKSISKPADAAGEFVFTEISDGDVAVEVFARDRRIIVACVI